MSSSTENLPNLAATSDDEVDDIEAGSNGLPGAPPLTLFGFSLAHYSHRSRLIIGTGGTIVFYVYYGFLQEWVFSQPGFRFSLFVTLMQFLMFASLSRVDLWYRQRQTSGHSRPEQELLRPRVPLQTYILMGLLLVLAFGLSNMSLLYLTYPTKVVLKASKLVAVMPLGLVVLNKTYSGRQYFSALLLVIGVVLFTLSDRIVSSAAQLAAASSFVDDGAGAHKLLLGCLAMGASLIADSLLGNLQERTLEQYRCCPQDLVFHNSIVGFFVLSAVTLLNGELVAAVSYCAASPWVLLRVLLLVFVGYLGVSVYLVVVKTSGIFVATMVATVRKFLTILLSFCLFPKPFNWPHGVGLLCVFAGVWLNSTGRRASVARRISATKV